MKLTLSVEFLDGSNAQVETNLWVITQWERKYRSKISNLADGIGAEDLAFLAYEGCKIAGIVVPIVFDDFIKKLSKVEVVDQQTENPTQGEPSADD